MFSLWVCPDCEAVGRRFAVRPARSGYEGYAQNGQQVLLEPQTVCQVSEWQCVHCGQVGRLLESSEAGIGMLIEDPVASSSSRRFRSEPDPAEQAGFSWLLGISTLLVALEIIWFVGQIVR